MPGKSPRLTLRIASYTAVALLFAAGALLWFVDQRATAQAESRAAVRAHFVADVLLPDRLTPADFARPVTGRRRSRLDILFRTAVHTQAIKRVSLIAPNGLITYSTDHRLISELLHARDGDVAAAFAGREIRAVDSPEIDGRR